MKKTMKKASRGMKRRKMGGDYMEPNKELKFGGPSKPRMRATKGLSYEEWKKQNPNGTVTDYNKSVRDQYSLSERVGGKMGDDVKSGNVRTPSSNVREVDSKGNQIYGTAEDRKEIKAVKAKQSNPYAAAKKRDSNLDSYIKQRNAAKKGSSEYNEAQNKINKAYGKGPTNRPTAKSAEKPKAAPAPMKTTVKPVDRSIKTGPAKGVTPEALSKGMAEAGLKQAGARLNKQKAEAAKSEASTKKSKPTKEEKLKAKATKIQDRRAKAQDRKEDRQDNRSNRSADRMFKKNERQGDRADNKQRRMDKREDNSAARQDKKDARQNRKALIKEGRAAVKQARKMKSGGYRKKAQMGAMGVASMIGGMAGNAMQNSKNPTMQKIGKGLGMASQVAGMAGGGGGGGAAGGDAAKAIGGAKAKKGRYKAKFGMLSVKAGIDNNPNPTAADRIAGAKMKDRRARKKKK